jgi:uncharacterized protein (TIGR02145 family)
LNLGGQNCSIDIPVNGPSEHTCGTENVHNPLLEYGSMTDQQGNVYKTIIIGGQEIMAENLNTSIYRNGAAISTNLSNSSWSTTTSGAWAYYNNDAGNACPYGKLYNWYACVDSRQLCPAGWHVPSNDEWTVLRDFLGGESEAGGKMKTIGNIEAATGLWESPNAGATNSSGFSGLPGGARLSSPADTYDNQGTIGYYWSSTYADINQFYNDGYVQLLYWQIDNFGFTHTTVNVGGSVRCFRD